VAERLHRDDKRQGLGMQITPDFCRMMARYNAWQNDGLRRLVATMPEADLRREQGAHFGTILGTLNHILWGDRIWMHRFAGLDRPEVGLADSPHLTPTAAVWGAERFRTDGQITLWAERLNAVDLVGNLSWTSEAAGRVVSRPLQMLVVHMFNHQTHHRGQVHAMLTAQGQKVPATDLFLMPD
jgi:uncharacterized damage-inducible protein DinB